MNCCSCKFEVSSQCSHGEIHQDRPYSTFQKHTMKCSTFIASGSSYTHTDWPYPQDQKPFRAQKKVMTNVSIKKKPKTSISRDSQCTKSKKDLTGNVFVCSCCTSTSAIIATAPCNEQHSLATWLTSLSHNLVSIATKLFLCKGMIPHRSI